MNKIVDQYVKNLLGYLREQGQIHNLNVNDIIDRQSNMVRGVVEDPIITDTAQITRLIDERRTIVLPSPHSGMEYNSDGFFRRYLQYLSAPTENGGKGWPQSNVDQLEKQVRNIFRRIIRPDDDAVIDSSYSDKRGLVIGRVQSGKTSNYIGLINLALDNDFDAIIILTSNNEDLRVQTQVRVEEGVWGYESGSGVTDQRIGVGQFDEEDKAYTINLNTTREYKRGEFSSSITSRSLTWAIPQIFVSKKDKNILNNLIYELHRRGNNQISGSLNHKLLLIDDEGDYSSIDKSRPDDSDQRAINARIRALLTIFQHRTLCSYTASPYANLLSYMNPDPDREILIEKDETEYEYILGYDLFPKDFVNVLPRNRGYFGVDEIFGSEHNRELLIDLDQMAIDQGDDWQQFFAGEWVDISGVLAENNPLKEGLIPNSMKIAIFLFYISSAIRRERDGSTENGVVHTTMLINTTHLTDPQEIIKENIISFHNSIKRRLDEDLEGLKSDLESVKSRYLNQNRFQEIQSWSNQIGNHQAIPTKRNNYEAWHEISSRVLELISQVSIISLNGKSDDDLHYPSSEHSHQIVIGGNKLSRGLTLEGLVISYFTRTSNYMDSMLQMGRWFGYRQGYIDICRIFLPREQIHQFSSISSSHKYLRDQVKQANTDDIRPDHFRYELLYNRELLRVTSGPFKQRLIQLYNDWQDQNVEPTRFKIDAELLQEDYTFFRDKISETEVEFVYDRSNANGKIEAYEVNDVGTDWVLDLIDNLNLSGHKPEKQASVRRYISGETQEDNNELLLTGEINEWGVFIKTLSSTNRSGFTLSTNSGQNEITVISPTRSNKATSGKYFEIIGGRLLDPIDESFDMVGHIRGINARSVRDEHKALLIIYLIDLRVSNRNGTNIRNPDLEEELNKLDENIPLVAYAFIFSERDDIQRSGSSSIYSETSS